jgi:hypothetical protein
VKGPIDLRLAAIGLAAGILITLAIGAPLLAVRQFALGGSRAGLPPPSAKASVTSPSPVLSASPGAVLPHTGATAGCPSGQLVSSADELKQALASAGPGTVIVMAAGTYAGQFEAKVSGTQQAPITLCGPRDAIIDGGEIKLGYSFYLNSADWWKVTGFSVQGGQKGVVTDHSHHDLIQNLYVHDIGDEGIHLREFSTDNTIDGNVVRNTGLHSTKFGEGIYVGTAHSNWCKYTSCNPDNSDRNVISNNDIANTTAENIDIKEGTTGGVIEGNRLAGDGMVASAASAWINVKGNEWSIVNNTGRHSIKDGFQVHNVYKGWGERNVFRTNRAEVDGPGYGFYVQSSSLQTLIACDNSAVAAGRGLSNERCA